MAGGNLDGAGVAKLEVLESALEDVQRMHGIVERMAIAVRMQQPTAPFVSQFKRATTPLVGLLRGQFAPIADHVSGMLLASSRGGGEQTRLRVLREGVAQLRQQLEVTIARVKTKHTTSGGGEE
jgi:hypothetical protein